MTRKSSAAIPPRRYDPCASSASIRDWRHRLRRLDRNGSRLTYVTSGRIRTPDGDLARAPEDHTRRPGRGDRRAHGPAQVALEKVFVNVNPQSTLLLGQARGTAICAAVLHGLPVAEYTALQVKQAVVGNGHAQKRQVQDMVRRLLKLGGRSQPRRGRRAGVRDLPRARRAGARAARDRRLSHEARPARVESRCSSR